MGTTTTATETGPGSPSLKDPVLWLLFATVVGVPLIQIPALHGDSDFPRRFLFALGVLVCARLLSQGGANAPEPSRPFSSLLLLGMAVGTVSLFWASSVFEGLVIVLHGLTAWMLLDTLGRASSERLSDDRLISLLAWGGIVVAAGGILQTHVDLNLFPLSPKSGSSIGNQNWAAEVLGLSLFASVHKSLHSPTLGRRLLFAVGSGLGAGLVIHTECRAVWLSLAVQSVLYALFWVRRRATSDTPLSSELRRAVAPLGLSFGLAVGLGMTDHQGLRTGGAVGAVESVVSVVGQKKSESNHVRWAGYQNTLSLIAKYPVLGVGVGNFGVRFAETSPQNHALLFNDFFGGWLQAHSDWLQLWSEMGVLFWGLVLLFVTLLFRGLARAVLQPGPEGASLLGVVLAVGGAVTMCFSFPAYNSVPLLFFAVGLALVDRHARRSGVSGILPASWVSGFRTLGVWAVGAGLLFWGLNLRAQASRTAMIGAELHGDPSETRRLAREVGRWMPLDHEWRLHFAAACLSQYRKGDPGTAAPGELSAGLDVLDAYLRAKPNRAYAHYLQGSLLFRQGDLGGAEQAFSSGLSLFPGSEVLRRERLAVRLQIRQASGVVEDGLAYLESRADDRFALAGRSVEVLSDLGRLDLAVPLLASLVSADQATIPQKELLGILWVSLRSGEEERGRALLRELYSGPYADQCPNIRVGKPLIQPEVPDSK